MDNQEEVNNLRVYGSGFQTKCIAAMVSDKSFLEQIVDIVSPEYFETDAHKWVVQMIISYFLEYKELATKDVFLTNISGISQKQEALKEAVKLEVFSLFNHLNDTDSQYVKDRFLSFCKLMKLKSAIWNSVEHLKKGNLESIKIEIDNAMKAGAERNLGHEYLAEVDVRMSKMCRECIRTNWGLMDELMDGGLGKGELGFVVAPAGSGKCIGPNTEIEIQYMETGIPITGNSGKEYIIWIKPFEKYNIGHESSDLFGWQIDNILFEIEKLEFKFQEQVNIHKK